MFQYTLQIRDLVHRLIRFTKPEHKIIDHRLFQRLRNVKQNGIASFVFPSINTTRFEHLLGACHVAGMIAGHLTTNPKWREYAKMLKRETSITKREDFVQLAHIYALIHDVGHLPLSHLFEYALEQYSEENGIKADAIAEHWTDIRNFEKVHEALGASIAKKYAKDIDRKSHPVREAVVRLMTEKNISDEDPLSIVKKIVDSDIDSDRIDFVARDGLLAGGEYGHHDIDRLGRAFFIERADNRWLLAYSDRAIHSIEALLLDRYRTHTWVLFHHRTIAINLLVRFLIVKMIQEGAITKEDFCVESIDAFSTRDDSWLWSLMRSFRSDDPLVEVAKKGVFHRSKKGVCHLWKARLAYREFQENVARDAGLTELKDENITRFAKKAYGECLRHKTGALGLVFKPGFKPTSKNVIRLYSEKTKGLLSQSLDQESKLVAGLQEIWNDEPQYHVLLLGDIAYPSDLCTKTSKATWLKKTWRVETIQYLKQKES